MSKIYIVIIGLLLSLSGWAQCTHSFCQHHKNQLRGGSFLTDPGNLRSDTLDIINYSINLDMTQMNVQQVTASCTIELVSKMDGVDQLHFDLLGLVVDSVKLGNTSLGYAQSGEELYITLPTILNENDAVNVSVFYHGSPESDLLWGGFYFNAGYAYNLGVGFVANPHNFGRIWFPCFDNFVERSSYDFHVLTNLGRTAYCGGMRTGVEVVGQDSLLTHWELNEQIPTYLASVSVTNYVHVEDSFQSIGGEEIPIWLTAKSVDTTDMKNSMINLVPWLQGAEQYYGPYRWSRVGYCAVPFNGGAMEHATNIAYPLFALDGGLGYETLYAHELAHHWWGDLVTCRNAYDMWINEGWARYSEALFEEVIYGEQAYLDFVRDNHKDVLLHAHQNDGARYPVSGIPHEITYGDHVYNKGADVAHTLRGYMGDADFFAAIQGLMNEYAFSDVSSETLRDYFTTYTAEDISSYFDNWIFDPGFPEFRVKSFTVTGSDNWLVTIEQHSHYAPQLYSNVPMQLSAMNANGDIVSAQIHATGLETTTEMNLPSGFNPMAFYLNQNDAISMAVLGEERWIYETGGDDFDFAEMDIDINNLGGMDSVFVRIENHFAAVDENQSNPEYFISPDRWWNVVTNANDEVYMDATIRYYGDQGANNFFDSLFFSYVETNGLNEDSIVLLYRPHGLAAWEEFGSYELVVTPGGNDNWTGRLEIDSLVHGHYAWAVKTGVSDVNDSELNELVHFTQTENYISLNTGPQIGWVSICDLSGRLVLEGNCNQTWSASTSSWPEGVYVVQVRLESGSFYRKKFLK
jgi:hypothetical protein